MKNWKNILSSILVSSLLVSLAPGAFAAPDSTETVVVGNGESVTVGDVTVTVTDENSVECGVYAEAYDGGSHDLTVEGSVSIQTSNDTVFDGTIFGVDAWSSGSVSIDISVDGDVSASVPNSSEYGACVGVCSHNYFFDNSTVISIGGDVIAEGGDYGANGIHDYSISSIGGETDISVTGSVFAQSPDCAEGVYIYTTDGDVKKHVEVCDSVNAVGNEAWGACVSATNSGPVELSVGGDISAEGDTGAGLCLFSLNGGPVTVSVGGDLSSDGDGLSLFLFNGDGSVGDISVTVEGTISGGEAPIRFTGDAAEAVTLTVWQIELNEDGRAVVSDPIDTSSLDCPIGYDVDMVEGFDGTSADTADTIEANILYIIRLEQPDQGGTLSLNGTTMSDGFEVAKEGDTVMLLATAADGYRLAAAYNGTGEKLPLVQDADGNYFLVVPKGGGVSLSAEFTLIPVVITEPDSKPIAAPAAAPTAKPKEKVEIAEATSDSNMIAVFVSADPSETKDEDNNAGEKEATDITVSLKFFDDMSFDLLLTVTKENMKTGDTVVNTLKFSGSFKFVDGMLTLTLEDGSVFQFNEKGETVITFSEGTALELSLSESFIENLKIKTQGSK